MKKLLFIYNPMSGKGRVGEGLSVILDEFTRNGWLTTAYPTQCRGDASRLAREVGGEYDRLICAGGDGTLSEVVTGLMALEHPPLLGYLPFGSTNDCATTLNLPRNPLEAAHVASLSGVPRPSDIGLLNDRPFVYVAAFGAFTQVAYATPQDMKNAFGHLAYIMEGIASLPTISPYHIKVEYDDVVIEDDFYFGMVTNAMSIGGMKTLNREHVVLDDGLFEVNLVKKPVSLADVADGFSSFLSPGVVSGGSLVHFQAARIRFTCDKPMSWTIDGEFGGSQEVNLVENRSKALTIVRGS